MPFEFCIVDFSKSHNCAISNCFGFPIAAPNERLSLENAPLSAFTHVRRKRLLPRTQFKRSFLHMPTGPLMSSCVPRTIIGDRKLRTCTCTLKNTSRRRAFSVLPLGNHRPIGLLQIGSDSLCDTSEEKDFQIWFPGIYAHVGEHFKIIIGIFRFLSRVSSKINLVVDLRKMYFICTDISTRILANRCAENTNISKILCLDRFISIGKIDDASNKRDITSSINSGIRHSGWLSPCHLFIVIVV